jgi:hypothetical protein
MAKKCEFCKKNVNAAAPTLKPARVSASSMIQPGYLRVAEPDAPEASPEAGWPQCCQPIHLTIRWATLRTSRRSYVTPSIGFVEDN